jgi:hypothetical protein
MFISILLLFHRGWKERKPAVIEPPQAVKHQGMVHEDSVEK